MFRWLQKYPHALETAYDATWKMIRPFRGRLKPGGKMERLFVRGEKLTKGAVFDCRMCGDCVLHSTGMTCPMTCPKNLRNGPCGGVRANGNCEVIPDMPCVWAMAWQRSQKMPTYGKQILHVLTPVDRRLADTSAWINDLDESVKKAPAGWNE